MRAAQVALACAAVCGGALGAGEVGWERPDGAPGKLYDKFYFDVESATDCIGMNGLYGSLHCYTDFPTAPLYLVSSVRRWEALPKFVRDQDGIKAVAVVLSASLTPKETATIFESFRTSTLSYTAAVLHSTQQGLDSTNGYSPVSKHPNNETDLYRGAQPAWNAEGTGLFGQRLPLFVYMKPEDLAVVEDKAEDNHKNGFSYPRKSAEFNFDMNSKGQTTIECLNNRTCDLIGRQSLWAASGPLEDSSTRNYIAVGMPLSGGSLYSTLSVPGEGAVIGTLVAALAAADALAAHVEAMKKTLLFLFFDAELYGRAGSMRFWNDVDSFSCWVEPAEKDKELLLCANPKYYKIFSNFTQVRKADIAHYVALDQLGVCETPEAAEDLNLYLYYDGEMYDRASGPTEEALSAFEAGGALRADENVRRFLPPSSLHSFLQIDGGAQRKRTDLGVVTLAGYNGKYANKFYGSIYDSAKDGFRLNSTQLARVAEVLANGLLRLSDGAGSATVSVNKSLVGSLTGCLAEDFNCPLVLSYFSSCETTQQKRLVPTGHLNLYPDTPENKNPNPLLRFAQRFLAQRWASSSRSSRESCNRETLCDAATAKQALCADPLEFCLPEEGGNFSCQTAFTWAHLGVSVAVTNTNGRWLKNETFKDVPAWAEARYKVKQGMRIYQQDNTTHEVLMILAGALLFFFSLGSIIFFRSHMLAKLKTD